MLRHLQARRREDGYTLIEVVICIVLLGILAAFGSSMIYDNVQSGVRFNKAQATGNEGRYVLGRITRELREMSYDMAAGKYSVSSLLTGTQSSIIFQRNIPNSTNTGFTPTYVAICYFPGTGGAPGKLTLAYSSSLPTCSPAPASVLTSSVTNFSLVFVDVNNNLSTTTGVTVGPDTLRAIDVTLEMTDSASPSPSGEVINQKIRVTMRNT